MTLHQLKIKSSSKLLLIAAIALLLGNIRNFITISRGLTLTTGLIFYLLFFIVLWNLSQTYDEPSTAPVDPTSDSWRTAAFAITGTTLLLASRFAHLRPSLHGLSNIAGWLLILASWLFPKSNWQVFTVAGLYLVVLSGIRWKEFAIFGSHIYITIALLALWLTVSALTFFFLTHRKPPTPPPELN